MLPNARRHRPSRRTLILAALAAGGLALWLGAVLVLQAAWPDDPALRAVLEACLLGAYVGLLLAIASRARRGNGSGGAPGTRA